MKRVGNLPFVFSAVLICFATAQSAYAGPSWYVESVGSPAPGLNSYIVYVDGAQSFENVTIEGNVHQVNYSLPGGDLAATVFIEDLPSDLWPYDTRFLFCMQDIIGPQGFPTADFSDTETNEGGNPYMADNPYLTNNPYGLVFETGMGTFTSGPGEGFTFDEELTDYTPFMQVVTSDTYPAVFLTGLAWDNGNEAAPFVVPVNILYCGSNISTNPSDGGTLEFPLARVGATVTAPLVISDGGNGCTVCPSFGMFPSADGEFGPDSPLLTGPLNNGSSESRTYTYTPNQRGSDTQQLTVKDADNNIYYSDSQITLSGTGVGPVFESSVAPGGTICFGNVQVDSFFDITFEIENATSDGDLGELTDLTLLDIEITGADADRFSLVDFSPETVLSALELESITVRFDTAGAAVGPYSATLTITTDQGAEFGAAGDQFAFQLDATAVPEPSILLLLAIGTALMTFSIAKNR